jgi:hypothetical protein
MQTLPENLHKGMTVYDSMHKKIGKVDDFKYSENETDPDVIPADLDGTDKRNGRESILESIAEAFGKEEIPEPLRSRLLNEGYIRLDTAGLMAKDRFILPDQIASAAGDEVVLNVAKDDLIKRP